jgi:hypothetical protein
MSDLAQINAFEDFPDRSPLLYELVTQRAKQLLKKGRLENAAYLLAEVDAELDLGHDIEITTVQGQMALLEQQRILGLITNPEYIIERNKALVSLYQIVKGF